MTTPMSERIKTATDALAQKAEHYATADGNYQNLVQQVMAIGGKAVLTRSFTLAEAEQVAAMMIAAIALARGDTETPKLT